MDSAPDCDPTCAHLGMELQRGTGRYWHRLPIQSSRTLCSKGFSTPCGKNIIQVGTSRRLGKSLHPAMTA